jgi:hypothetical protein
MIFKRISIEELSTISIKRLLPTPNNVVGVKASLAKGFLIKYTYKEVRKSFDRCEYYGIVDNGEYSIIAVMTLDKNDKSEHIKNAINANRYVVIFNLVSREKGRGKLLVEYVLDKYKDSPFYLSARHKSLISYYEKLGFRSIMTDKENHYPMVKQ